MNHSMRSFVRDGGLLAAVTMGLAAPAFAADRAEVAGGVGGNVVLIDPAPQPWGASETALVIGAGNMVPPRNTVTWDTMYPQATGIAIYQTNTTSGSWIHQFHLPSGALLDRVELEACDTSNTAGLNFGMSSGLVPGGLAQDITAIGTTGDAPAPGCAFFSIAPTAATTIDNGARNYWIYLFWSGTGIGPATNFHSFRVYYRLQVSPAPATATFPNDVPTNHPFFRFVEAMAASGLTGGCAAGSFCPDNPVTRGQMAVFLASALGLHFPN